MGGGHRRGLHATGSARRHRAVRSMHAEQAGWPGLAWPACDVMRTCSSSSDTRDVCDARPVTRLYTMMRSPMPLHARTHARIGAQAPSMRRTRARACMPTCQVGHYEKQHVFCWKTPAPYCAALGTRLVPAGVLQQAHGADVVAGELALRAARRGRLVVQRRRVHQQRRHAGKVLHAAGAAKYY